MEWDAHLTAIRPASDAAKVHIIERRYLEPQNTAWRYASIKTYCGIELAAPFDECQQEDIDCETCVTKVEEQQAYWKKFWAGPEGTKIYRLLSGMDKREKEWRESAQRTEAVIREARALNDLIQDCLKHYQPVFTLELPDEVLLKLLDYGSVGEILLGFKMSEETRQALQTKLGKEGFALLGSRLITKGLLKANDPIFNRKWT